MGTHAEHVTSNGALDRIGNFVHLQVGAHGGPYVAIERGEGGGQLFASRAEGAAHVVVQVLFDELRGAGVGVLEAAAIFRDPLA